MIKLRMRLSNSGEDRLDLQETSEDTNDTASENIEVAAERDYIIIDQAQIQSTESAGSDESTANEHLTTLGKLNQRINKVQGHRGFIQMIGRKHKRVRYTESIK